MLLDSGSKEAILLERRICTVVRFKNRIYQNILHIKSLFGVPHCPAFLRYRENNFSCRFSINFLSLQRLCGSAA
jgi:hypothetical protein